VAPPIAVTVAVPATTAAAAASAAVLPSAAATTTLFGPVAALAVNRAVPTGFKRHGCGLATTGANHGGARAHAAARAVTTLMLGMGWSVTSAPACTLFSLPARFAAPGRGVTALLEKLLFTSCEHKFLSAVATG
jgi:hypothetical protein